MGERREIENPRSKKEGRRMHFVKDAGVEEGERWERERETDRDRRYA